MRYATFLTADRQLTKAFYASGQADPYPLVRDFSSFTVAYNGLPELMEAMELSGSAGACMLKGALSRDINNEPRVGLTDPNANTDLLILDYDSDGGFSSVTDLLEEIDPSLASTDYIFQHSASSGITGKTGIRGHIFFLLEEPVSPNILKQWLKKINLTSEKFKNRIKLSRNAMALCYALDITINQNDKLVYIAPPQLIGIDDPIEHRFSFHCGEHRTYKFNSLVSAESNRTKEHRLIEDLQDAAGLTKRTPKYRLVSDYEVLINPASCIVSDTKDCGKFIRVNLNGGDSFAYWYAKDNPEILHNFKGEPACYLRDIAPEYYEQLNQRSQEAALRPFVFRDVASNVYYNAVYDEGAKKLGFCYASSRPALNDFMTQRGAPAPRAIPDWEVTFDPTTNTAVDFHRKKLNLFNPTKYLLNEMAPGPFPIIERVIRHICVDEVTYEHFIKWLAHIIQFRTKTQTAWVMQGAEGTGKGTLFHQILTPILGRDHTFMITQDQADEQFNGYLRSNMLLFLDEGDIESSKQADRMLAKFRSIITEPVIPLRMMRSNPILIDNYTNLIIATNKSMPVKLTQGDRRYNIAPRQTEKLIIDDVEYATIKKELGHFTAHLKAQKIGATDAMKILKTDARLALQELSKTVADNFFDALKRGDLDFFTEALVDNVPVNDPGYIAYAKVIAKWMA
ncbi:MAG: primase-helicase family protein, partial [Candidatus Shapirobacteria bacterium]